jgi:prephenate dehydratase
MKISYQGIPGSYSHITAGKVAEQLQLPLTQLMGYTTFNEVRANINENTLAVIPIENSRAGSIHDNLYNFLRYDSTIIGEVHTEIHHVLLSQETDITRINKAFSHPQALSQCYTFLKNHHIEPIEYFDTAGAAKHLADQPQHGTAAIASAQAGNLYKLNVIEQNIQDQEGNTTRFLVIAPKGTLLEYPEKQGKMTILFQARDIPASLYKCLGAFATNAVNLTKIESIPSFQDPFMYTFRLEFEGKRTDDPIRKSLNELAFFTKNMQILGEY